MLPNNSLPHWCIIGIRSSPNKQVSSPSNTNARTRQHMQISSPMDHSTLRNLWQRASWSASQMRNTRRATINQHPLPGKDHHHQKSAETQTWEGCIPSSWQARPVGLARLRSGHNRLNAHMYRKLKIVPSPTCPCGEEDQTTEHVLQRCNRHQPERIAQWPSETPLHQKLYGGLEDLKKTSNFITAAGLVV